MKEIWKSVTGYPYYEVSNLGRVRTLNRWVEYMRMGKLMRRLIKGQLIKPVADKDGYVFVGLVGYGSKPKCIKYVHRMVARAFHGKPPPGKDHVLHGDDCPSNNIATNLRWGSNLDNVKDRDSKGRQASGARNGWAGITDKQARDSRTYVLLPEVTVSDIMELLGIKEGLARSILNGRHWSQRLSTKKSEGSN